GSTARARSLEVYLTHTRGGTVGSAFRSRGASSPSPVSLVRLSTDSLAASLPATEAWTPDDAERLYHVQAWGGPYFHVNEHGHAAVRPGREESTSVDLWAVAQELDRQGVQFPALVRFQDLLATRVVELNEAFLAAMAEAGYEGGYN